MRSFALTSMLALLSMAAVAGAPPTAPQEQASALAVPEPEQSTLITGAVVVTHCNLIIGLVLIDAEGKPHPVQLEGRSRQDVQLILNAVPAAGVVGVRVQCGSKDGTPL